MTLDWSTKKSRVIDSAEKIILTTVMKIINMSSSGTDLNDDNLICFCFFVFVLFFNRT